MEEDQEEKLIPVKWTCIMCNVSYVQGPEALNFSEIRGIEQVPERINILTKYFTLGQNKKV